MAVVLEKLVGKVFPHAGGFAFDRQQHPLGLQVHKHRQVVVPFLAHAQITPATISCRSRPKSHRPRSTASPASASAQRLQTPASARGGGLPKGPASCKSFRRHRSGRAAGGRRSPIATGRHSDAAGTVQAHDRNLARPSARNKDTSPPPTTPSVLRPDQHLAFFVQAIHLSHTPTFAHHRNLMKHFLGYHKN
jgi:hypothetical protein